MCERPAWLEARATGANYNCSGSDIRVFQLSDFGDGRACAVSDVVPTRAKVVHLALAVHNEPAHAKKSENF